MDSADLFRKLKNDSRNWKTEAEVRSDWLRRLRNELDIRFEIEQDRNDATYNQVIIEFKNKGLFNGLATSPKFKEAVFDRLKPYIQSKAKKEGLDVSAYTGIATDGEHIAFCYMQGDDILAQALMPFSEVSIHKVVLALQQNSRRALTTQNLIADLGHTSDSGAMLMGALSKGLAADLSNPNNTKAKMLFEEWRTLFGQVANLTASQTTEIHNTLRFAPPNVDVDDRIPSILYVIHTYNALIMKLLGAEIVSQFEGLTQYKYFCEHTATQDDKNLLNILQNDIERSHLFENVGIRGFVGEAIFSWYLEIGASNLSELTTALRNMLIQISLFRMDDLASTRSRDVLKGFYQSLVPDTLRKSLGEFYTPDWLVKITADKAQVDNWLEQKVLDPTCGSGSFIVEVILRKRLEAEAQGWTAEKTLKHLLENVWGFDLNPLAVQAARVNFLIAISDLFTPSSSEEIELPILLADSVYSPASDPNSDDDTVVYQIGSIHANLSISLPRELAFDRRRLEFVFSQMEEAIERNQDFSKIGKRLLKQGLVTPDKWSEWEDTLAKTYEQVADLHKRNWNGIWFRIIKNFFWSATTGRFGLVLGNPPWVRWSALPDIYKERIKPTCEQYKIFSDTPFHGGNELDISGMLTYTVADKWLSDNGKLIFVITQTHFQSPSSQGFRSFAIDDKYLLQPLEIDDLKGLKPFSDATNRTAIAAFQKVRASSAVYPVPYKIWSNKHGYSRIIPEELSKEEVLDRVVIISQEANPVDEARSPWIIMSQEQFRRVEVIRGSSEWIQGRKGVTADLNGLYMVNLLDYDKERKRVLIETRPDAGRKTKQLVAKKYWIESDLLYPLLKGASDFSACYIQQKNDLYIIVPNRGITKHYLEQAEEKIEYSLENTRKYFLDYEALLLERSTYKARLAKYPFYMIYNVGAYTFSPYKVVWAEQSRRFRAAVVTGKEMPVNGYRVYVPDHKLYFVDFEDKNSAYYLCGLLNAPLVQDFVQSHTISIQVSNIFKHMNLPEFDTKSPTHQQLCKLTEQAHSEHDEAARTHLVEQIGRLAENIIEG